MRKPLFMANWKMNKTAAEARHFANVFSVQDCWDADVVICPPLTALDAFSQACSERTFIGAQNCFFALSGAYTGEVSPVMLQEFGVRYVLVGHSERRQFFHEDDDVVTRKAAFLSEQGLVPVLCLGESKEQRDAGQALATCDRQLTAVITKAFLNAMPSELVIAYEPIWAIGTGQTASAEDAEEMMAYLRMRLGELLGSEMAEKARFLYGGSVNSENSAAFMAKSNIDGALVGGASLNPEDFTALIEKGCVCRG